LQDVADLGVEWPEVLLFVENGNDDRNLRTSFPRLPARARRFRQIRLPGPRSGSSKPHQPSRRENQHGWIALQRVSLFRAARIPHGRDRGRPQNRKPDEDPHLRPPKMPQRSRESERQIDEVDSGVADRDP
jgi:hypothetical protein